MRCAAEFSTAFVIGGLPTGTAAAKRRRAQSLCIESCAQGEYVLEAMRSARVGIMSLAAGPAAAPIITISSRLHRRPARLRPASISLATNTMRDRAETIRIKSGNGCLSAQSVLEIARPAFAKRGDCAARANRGVALAGLRTSGIAGGSGAESALPRRTGFSAFDP
jgi:hypothetical protein